MFRLQRRRGTLELLVVPLTSGAAELLAFGTAESATDIVELWRRRIKTELDPADLDCRWDEIWESLPEDLHQTHVSHGWYHPQEGGKTIEPQPLYILHEDRISNVRQAQLPPTASQNWVLSPPSKPPC